MANAREGRIVAVLIGMHPPLQTLREKQESEHATYLATTPVASVQVTLEGIVGDRHAGFTRRADGRTPFYPRGTPIGNHRQVSLVSLEDLAQLAATMGVPHIAPAWLGANIVVEGVAGLSKLAPATRCFFPDDATLVVTAENMPCVFPGRLIQHQYPDVQGLARMFPKSAIGLRGLVAWVERAGTIRTGDTVRIEMLE